MFTLYANKTQLTVCQREPITSGSVNAYRVRLKFSPDWEGLTRTAVFKAGAVSRSVSLDDTCECIIPWEVLTTHGRKLTAGVYGTKDGNVVLPTIWADMGTILEGVSTGKDAQPPTPELWQQELAGKGDSLSYDGANLSLMARDKPLSTVQIAGGGQGGVSDHRLLSNRDEVDQHPIESISGLKNELDRIPEPVEPLTNEELEEMLK